MLHRCLGASVLAPLPNGVEYRPALDECVELRWNIVRVFCGALPWANQVIEDVYRNLPPFLDECAARGLNAYLAYHTEAGTGYDLEAHTDRVEEIARAYSIVALREVANEADHDTQGGRLSPERCADLADRMNGIAAHGATIMDDESDEYAGRDFTAVHLDRGRDPWNMVRRVREIYAHTERDGKHATNQEPIGADEANEPGKRCADPAIFFTMGALGRLFDCMSIFHSEDGLHARRLGPVQRQCAQAFGDGFRAGSNTDVLTYKNTGHEGSPVRDANFEDEGGSGTVVRVYSGVMPDGLSALTVPLGMAGNSPDACGIELNAGWRWDALLGEMTGQDGKRVQVWRTAAAPGTRVAPAKGPREWLRDRLGRRVLGEAPGVPR